MARNELLDAAERLIAERGVQVPLRDIAVAAGQRNNSAVNYHFRGRSELIAAVVARRLEPMERERALMWDRLDDEARSDVSTLLQIMVQPLIEVDSRHYARFLQAASVQLPGEINRSQGEIWPQILEGLARAIPTADPSARRRRVNAIGATMFALLAERERDLDGEGDVVSSPAEIVAVLAAVLTAPVPSLSPVMR